jgi:metal-responsive CopG/Arc/MetJ family transcriptional regulator
MKTKTSVTLTPGLLDGIDKYAGEFKSRSQFIEVAVKRFLRHLEREEMERRDLQIINRRADTLNEEAEDVLRYQVPV